MKIDQHSTLRTNNLTIERDGLRVKTRYLLNYSERFIPFEELQFKKQKTVVERNTFISTMTLFFFLLSLYNLSGYGRNGNADNYWFYANLFIGIIGICLMNVTFKNEIVIPVFGEDVIILSKKPDQTEVQDFIKKLKEKAKLFLTEKYIREYEYLTKESSMANLNLLDSLGHLNEEEYLVEKDCIKNYYHQSRVVGFGR